MKFFIGRYPDKDIPDVAVQRGADQIEVLKVDPFRQLMVVFVNSVRTDPRCLRKI